MKTRKLGTLEVSEIGFGCMSVSANYGPAADRNQGIAVIRSAYEKGVVKTKAPTPAAVASSSNCVIKTVALQAHATLYKTL